MLVKLLHVVLVARIAVILVLAKLLHLASRTSCEKTLQENAEVQRVKSRTALCTFLSSRDTP